MIFLLSSSMFDLRLEAAGQKMAKIQVIVSIENVSKKIK